MFLLFVCLCFLPILQRCLVCSCFPYIMFVLFDVLSYTNKNNYSRKKISFLFKGNWPAPQKSQNCEEEPPERNQPFPESQNGRTQKEKYVFLVFFQKAHQNKTCFQRSSALPAPRVAIFASKLFANRPSAFGEVSAVRVNWSLVKAPATKQDSH